MMTPSATATMTVPFTVPRTVSTILLASRSPGSPSSRSAVSSTPVAEPGAVLQNDKQGNQSNRKTRTTDAEPDRLASGSTPPRTASPESRPAIHWRSSDRSDWQSTSARRALPAASGAATPARRFRSRGCARPIEPASDFPAQPGGSQARPDKQHQSDEDRKRKRRPDIRGPAGDARGVLSIGRPDGQGDDDGPAQRRQEILRHPEGEDDQSDRERDTRRGPRSGIVWKRWLGPGSLSARRLGSHATRHQRPFNCCDVLWL